MQIKPIDQDRLEMITGGRNCCLFDFVSNFTFYYLKLNAANDEYFFSSTIMYIAC